MCSDTQLAKQETSVNITAVHTDAGQVNVIPARLTGTLDLRTCLSRDVVRELLKEWQSGLQIEYEIIQEPVYPSRPQDSHSIKKLPVWSKIESVLSRHFDQIFLDSPFPGGTDSRFIRALDAFKGLSLGISPIVDTQTLLHDVNEHIPVDSYMKAIAFYTDLFIELLQ